MRCTILLAAAVLFVTASPLTAVIEFNDGQVHTIEYEVNDNIRVDYESPGLRTALDIDGARTHHYLPFLSHGLDRFGAWKSTIL